MTTFACDDCGHSAGKWFGRCSECGSWSSARSIDPKADVSPVVVSSLGKVSAVNERAATGLGEVDRVLGGGLVRGAVVLLAGEPGIGKSTLVLQIMDSLTHRGATTLLVTGEESLPQVAMRGRRLGVAVDRLPAAAVSSADDVLAACAAESPEILIVDSIQTMHDAAFDQAPGTPVQVRECTARLVRHAKESGTMVLLVGHVTKDGAVAGPKTLEHAVDAVLFLDGERSGSLRLLRSVKNRFGSCDETGVFTMTERGFLPVGDPSAMLLADRRDVPGSAVFCALEGTRPLLAELQALVSVHDQHRPRRVATGVDPRRLDLLLGVLARHASVDIDKRDVFAAAAGGITVREPGADLALCIALASAKQNRTVAADTVAIGEVGLGGEVRRVPALDRRLHEAARLGFRRALVPRGTENSAGLHVVSVEDIAECLRLAFTGDREHIRRVADVSW